MQPTIIINNGSGGSSDNSTGGVLDIFGKSIFSKLLFFSVIALSVGALIYFVIFPLVGALLGTISGITTGMLDTLISEPVAYFQAAAGGAVSWIYRSVYLPVNRVYHNATDPLVGGLNWILGE